MNGKNQEQEESKPDRLRIVLEANKCKIYQGDKDVTPPHIAWTSICGSVGEYSIVTISLIADEIEIESQDAQITEDKEDESLIKIGGNNLDIPLRRFLNDIRQQLVDTQTDLNDALADYFLQRAEAARRGESEIKISTEGLSPALELVMFEIIERTRVAITTGNK